MCSKKVNKILKKLKSLQPKKKLKTILMNGNFWKKMSINDI